MSLFADLMWSASSGSVNWAYVGGSPGSGVGLASNILDHGHPRGTFDHALLPVQGDLSEGAKSSIPSSEEEGIQSESLPNAVNTTIKSPLPRSSSYHHGRLRPAARLGEGDTRGRSRTSRTEAEHRRREPSWPGTACSQTEVKHRNSPRFRWDQCLPHARTILITTTRRYPIRILLRYLLYVCSDIRRTAI